MVVLGVNVLVVVLVVVKRLEGRAGGVDVAVDILELLDGDRSRESLAGLLRSKTSFSILISPSSISLQ